MTEEQINIAIAEVSGIKTFLFQGKVLYEVSPKLWDVNVPDYCNDLNAMHEAELSLKFDYYKFTRRLAMVCERDRRCIESAPARQRAEAFLRTLGKWEGGPQ